MRRGVDLVNLRAYVVRLLATLNLGCSLGIPSMNEEDLKEMPSDGDRRARAFITKAEKAKKTPAISPQPSAAKSVTPNIKSSNVAIIASRGSAPDDRRDAARNSNDLTNAAARALASHDMTTLDRLF